MKKFLLLLCLLTGCSEINKKVGLKDDNPIEEAVEEVIKEKTGVVVDFTPTSEEVKENNKNERINQN